MVNWDQEAEFLASVEVALRAIGRWLLNCLGVGAV